VAEFRIKPINGGFPGLTALSQRATVRVLNRVAASVRAGAAKAIAEDMGIKLALARRSVEVKKANFSTMEASVIATGKRIPLYELGARPRTPGNRPVSYQGEAGRTTVPSAFVARMPSGHIGVFRRIGPPRPNRRGRYAGQRRQKIIELFGPAAAWSFGNEKVLGVMRNIIRARMPIEMKQAQNFYGGGASE
jgi:hypothetical protein